MTIISPSYKRHINKSCVIATGVMLFLLIWLSTSFGIPIARAGMISPTGLLNADGTMNLTAGKAGTVDVRGWNVQIDPKRGPVFAPETPQVDGWSGLEYGVSYFVSAIAVSGNEVYVGGGFTSICGNAACDNENVRVNYIAKWNGMSWSALGNGLNDTVRAIAINGSSVYIGGFFNEVCDNETCDSNNTRVNHIAKWDNGIWSSLSYGVDDAVYALAVVENTVYVGGDFFKVCGNSTCSSNNVTVHNLAKWNGNSWSPLGHGVRGGGIFPAVRAFAVSGSYLYVGGWFNEVCGNVACDTGNVRVNHIARWNGNSWSALASGLSDAVLALSADGNKVYVGGAFNEVCGNAACDSGNIRVNRIARWNGNSWSALASGVNGNVLALERDGSDMYVGGAFAYICGNRACNSGNSTVNYVSRWDGSNFSALGNGSNYFVFAFAMSNSDVYVGGVFSEVCGNAACNSNNVHVNHISKYTPSSTCTTNPARPTLTAPKDGKTLAKSKVTLKWNDVACETKYKVVIKDAVTNKIKFSANLGADITQVKTSALPMGKTYKWFVKACNSIGCAKSTTRQFTLAP